MIQLMILPSCKKEEMGYGKVMVCFTNSSWYQRDLSITMDDPNFIYGNYFSVPKKYKKDYSNCCSYLDTAAAIEYGLYQGLVPIGRHEINIHGEISKNKVTSDSTIVIDIKKDECVMMVIDLK